MKKYILTFVLLVSGLAFAQAQDYATEMKSYITELNTLENNLFNDIEKVTTLQAKFEKLANGAKSEWLPYYYAAYLQAQLGFKSADKSKNDAIADKAEQLLEKAEKAGAKKNSEIYCIKSLLCMVRIVVDPMVRYFEYSTQSEDYLSEALKFDSTNPRPYLMKAQTLATLPAAMGGGCDAAEENLLKAIKLFEEFKPAYDFAPTWGKVALENLRKKCSK